MFTDVQLLQIKNAVMRILHVPGNYGGGVLEMAVAVDCHLPAEQLKEGCRQIAQMLKKDETFRNVRLNLIKWSSDEKIEKEVVPMAFLLTGRAFSQDVSLEVSAEEKGEEQKKVVSGRESIKTLDELFRQLKLFYARSKVILVLTDGSYHIADRQNVKEHLQPFLAGKLLLLQNGEQITGRQLFLRQI